MMEIVESGENKFNTDLGKVKIKKKYLTFARKRHLFFIFATVVGLGLPFLKLEGRRLFLMSFLHKNLELFGSVFSASQLYVIPLLIFAFAGWILFWTALGGRVWCGWGCPQTIMRTVFRDFIQGFLLGMRDRSNKQKPLNMGSTSMKVRYVLSLVLWAAVCLLVAANLSWYFIDVPEWFSIVNGPFVDYPFTFVFWVGLAGFLFVDVVVLQENFCKLMCPYARIQSVFFDRETALVTYLEKRGNNLDGSRGMKNFKGELDKSGDCTNCLACVKICPTGIDIRNGLQLGCIQCLECIDACQPVMERKGVPNLIQWTTFRSIEEGGGMKFLRPRTFLYGIIVTIAVVALFVIRELKQDFGIKINHDSGSYFKNNLEKRVENGYILLLTNSTQAPKNFKIVVRSKYPLEVIFPKSIVEIPANGLVKKTLMVSIKNSDLPGLDQSRLPFDVELYDAENPIDMLDKVHSNFFVPPKE